MWTGSTNWTAAGIFGQSNVGHTVRDEAIAAAYLEYWAQLNADPTASHFRPYNDERTPFANDAANVAPDTDPAPGTMQAVFSPRGADGKQKYAALERYAALLAGAKESAHLTAAFGLSTQLGDAIEQGGDHVVYLLLENDGQATSRKTIRSIEQQADRGELRVRISRGASFSDTALANAGVLDRWHEETLSDLNTHVKYVHTKYMVLDALTDDPIVITGSANFSEASTNKNDENMLVIRGDTRVAHIYLCEYMRLFRHFYFRGKFNEEFDRGDGKDHLGLLNLHPDDSWTAKYFQAGNVRFDERQLFSGFRDRSA